MTTINLSKEELAYMGEYYRKEYVATLEKLNHLENILKQIGGVPATPGRQKPDLKVTLAEPSVPAAAGKIGKRKRGRPVGWRKNKNAESATSTAAIAKQKLPTVRLVDAANTDAARPVVKKRGRPVGWRKAKTAAAAPATEETKVKKKRSRPVGRRKNPEANSTPAPAMVKIEPARKGVKKKKVSIAKVKAPKPKKAGRAKKAKAIKTEKQEGAFEHLA